MIDVREVLRRAAAGQSARDMARQGIARAAPASTRGHLEHSG